MAETDFPVGRRTAGMMSVHPTSIERGQKEEEEEEDIGYGPAPPTALHLFFYR